MTTQATYDELVKRCKEISVLGSTASVLYWDQHTYMPPAGTPFRADQLGLLARMTHEMFTDPKINELLSRLEQSDLVKDEESPEAANIRELRYQYDKQTKLPKELVEEITKTTSLAQEEWAAARRESDFKRFLPWLEKILDLSRQKADAYGYEGEPYNALLVDYEQGASVDDIV